MGYLEFIEEKEKKKDLLREDALKEAERLSNLLRNEFKYDALYLIGSIIKDRGFTRQSDIDFVIKGLQKDFFLKALAFLIHNCNFHIDLKPFEELDAASRLMVEKKGRKL